MTPLSPRLAVLLILAGIAAGPAALAADVDGGVGDDGEYETVVEGEPIEAPGLPGHRAGSEVTREEIEHRLPRSAPDALRYEPGVFVQQSAHSQGSAYIRGMTGQQTLLLFDGIRLNNSTYRQGPNQYFFTLDSATIESIEVMRGGGSTEWGSDALGGVILARPIEPSFNRAGSGTSFDLDPHVIARVATADHEYGARAASNVAVLDSLAVFGGVGYRSVGRLESGGQIAGPGTGGAPLVPRFESDGRTQRGTGFDELTADGAVAYRVAPDKELKLAAYTYRQLDAPRTDQCPAAYAPHDECFVYDEQFRDLVYGAYLGEHDSSFFRRLRATVSWQRQHERYTLGRPGAFVEDVGRDTVHTAGVTLKGSTREARPASWLGLSMEYGADTYYDLIDSHAWITFTDIDYTEERSRGQYLDGSSYLYGGAFAQVTAELTEWTRLRAGGRLSWIGARAVEDPESGSHAVSREWFPGVWNAGLELVPAGPLTAIVNVDRSFRAPNLDDLTSRQQTGPGFQFENAELSPERAMTYEAGLRLKTFVTAELWGFVTHLDDAIVRSPRQTDDCPESTPQCDASWNRFQLVNAGERSLLRGLEAILFAELVGGLGTRATVAWMWGEGPNTGDPPDDPSIDFEERVPLSRVPPLNGTVEILWKSSFGFSTGASLRWAAAQTRLALSDVSDERIPPGGTPGFAVMDLRFAYRINTVFLASMTFENVFDTAYRYHGSSVNGPGRGVIFLLDIGPMWKV